MTDAELRDAAWRELEQTTVGWNRVAHYPPDKLAGTHWGKGKALLDQIGGAPTPPPPSGTYTYRFATFDPATDKITGTVNAYNGPYTNNWWVPGVSQPPTGNPWPGGGGIHELRTPWGPGLELVCTREMLYPNLGDTRLCRFGGDPTDTSKFPGGSWIVRGRNLTFEWTWLWPASGNPGGWVAGELIEGWFTAAKSAAGPNAVFHHLYLEKTGGNLTYYLGRSDFAASNGQSWQRYPSNQVLPADTPHHLKVEMRLSATGDGYLRAFTNGNKWADYTGVTMPSNWGAVYAHNMDIRPPLGGPTNTLQWINHRVTVS